MTRDEWLALAKRCEQATGPDRRLDAEIFQALCGEQLRGALDRIFSAIDDGDDPDWLTHYTSSLDAITDLIERELPGSRRNSFFDSADHPFANVGAPEAQAGIFPADGKPAFSEARTEPLARCAAFCKAMAEKAG